MQILQVRITSPDYLTGALGLCAETVRLWVRAAERGTTPSPAVADETKREELRRLRRENQVLWMEREILRKAAAFFAKETR